MLSHQPRLLPPEAIQQLFTTGFRRGFQVPADAITIADRINLWRHHDWIEAFLVRHRSVA